MDAHSISKHKVKLSDLVKFQKLKLKYFKNEDIKVEYILDPQVHQWPRDWIGLYPRGWSNLQQYITFEWAICRPCDEMLANRIEIFKHSYYSEAVETDKEYQFLYVTKNMKVLGSSTYFGFLPAMPFSSVVKSDISMLHSQQNGLKRAPGVYKLLKSITPHLSDINKLPIRTCKAPTDINCKPQKSFSILQQSLMQLNNCSGTSYSSQTVVNHSTLQNSKQNVYSEALCQADNKEESDHAYENVYKKVKSAAEEIHSLQNKIKELENLLEKSKVSQKIFKLAAQQSKREKVTYQNFVSDLLDALSKKKVVRVIDGQGTEMLVKCVQNENEAPTDDQVSAHQPNTIKETPRERRLKAVIGFQEQTIQQLQQCLACRAKENESSKDNKPDQEEQSTSHEVEPLFTVVHKKMEFYTPGISDERKEKEFSVSDIHVISLSDNESQTSVYNEKEATSEECSIQKVDLTTVESEPKEYSEGANNFLVLGSENRTEVVNTPNADMLLKIDTESIPIEPEKPDIVTSPVSPTAVVINGESVRFTVV